MLLRFLNKGGLFMNTVLFRVEGDQKRGMGHVYRISQICRKLSEKKVASILVTTSNLTQLDILQNEYITIIEITSEMTDDGLKYLKEKFQFEVVVLDKLNNDVNEIILYKKYGKVIAFDDIGAGGKEVDLLINGILNVSDATSYKNLMQGPDYIVLNIDKNIYPIQVLNQNVKKVLLSFGGSDPMYVSLYAIRDLINNSDLYLTVTVGPAYSRELVRQLELLEQDNKNLSLVRTNNIASLIRSHDVCVISGGITLFEVAYLGIPAIVISQVEHQVITANRFAKENVCISLGIIEDLKFGILNKEVNYLKENFNRRKIMSENGKNIVDGQGIIRVVNLILHLFSKRR